MTAARTTRFTAAHGAADQPIFVATGAALMSLGGSTTVALAGRELRR